MQVCEMTSDNGPRQHSRDTAGMVANFTDRRALCREQLSVQEYCRARKTLLHGLVDI